MASWMTASDVAVRYSLGGCDPCGCTLPAPPIRRPGVQPTFGAPSRPAAGSMTDITDESKGRSRGSAPVAGSDARGRNPRQGTSKRWQGRPIPPGKLTETIASGDDAPGRGTSVQPCALRSVSCRIRPVGPNGG